MTVFPKYSSSFSSLLVNFLALRAAARLQGFAVIFGILMLALIGDATIRRMINFARAVYLVILQAISKHSDKDSVPDDEPRDSQQEVISNANAFVTNGRLVQLACKLFETSLSTWSGWFAEHGTRQSPVQPSATERIRVQSGYYRTWVSIASRYASKSVPQRFKGTTARDLEEIRQISPLL